MGALLVGVLGLVTAAAAWQDVSRARAQLGEARVALVGVVGRPAALRSPAGRSAARSSAAEVAERIDGVDRRLRHSLPLRLAGVLPGLSTQRRGILRLVADARTAAGIGRRLVEDVDAFTRRDRIRQSEVPLEGVRRLRLRLAAAGAGLDGLAAGDDGLWGGLAAARRRLDTSTREIAGQLRGAVEAMGAADTYLGTAGPRRYLLALQNNAEMRDQGMVLSFAVVRAENGRLAVERSGPITELALSGPISYPVPAGMDAVFGGLAPNRLWQSVNATADFAWSGRAMAEMAQQATGSPVDGVIALDVPGLAGLLDVVGPVTVEGVPRPVDAGNAAAVLLDELYADFPRLREQGERREQLGRVAAAVVARVAEGNYDALGLGGALGDAAAGGHFRLWSADRSEQAVFERRGLGGSPAARAADRTLHLSVQNATATKLDYFVKPRVEMRVAVTPAGVAVVDTEVIVANTAPLRPPASYQFGPDGFSQTRAGQYIGRVYFWGPRGAVQAGSVEESGLRLNQGPTTVEPGQERVVRFQTVIPSAVRHGRLDLRLVPQPRLEPMALTVRISAPGWRLDGARVFEAPWDRVVDVSWKLRR